MALESNKARARSYLSPSGHREDSKLRHPAARHLSDKLSNNWSSLIDLAVEDCVLNCLERGGGGVLRNAVDIWISVSKLCLKMMAADLRKPALDPSACVLRSPSLSTPPPQPPKIVIFFAVFQQSLQAFQSGRQL